MPELFFEIKFNADQASLNTVKEQVESIQQETAKAQQTATAGSQKQAQIEKKALQVKKEKLKALIREKNIAEANFRLGNMSQAQLEQTTAEIFEQANAQGLLSAEVDATGAKYKQLAQAQVRAQSGFTGISQQSARANQSLMNLGRIVQDLPFGFLGISNNIAPALESFKALREESGSTGKAFGLLLKSMMGSGGIIFALGSLLPTAVLIAQKGFNMYSKSAGKAENAIQSLNDTTRTFINESAQLRLDGAGFLNVFELEEKINSTNRILDVFRDTLKEIGQQVEEDSRRFVGYGQAVFSNAEQIREFNPELTKLKEQFQLTDEDIENITQTLEDFTTELRRAKAVASLDTFAVYRDGVERTVDKQIELAESGLAQESSLTKLADAYRVQASALKDVALENEDAMDQYIFLLEKIRELDSAYNGLTDAQIDNTVASEDNADAVEQTNSALEAQLRLRKLLTQMPDREEDFRAESRALAGRALIDQMRSDREISQATGLAQKKLEIERWYQEQRFVIATTVGVDQLGEAYNELELAREQRLQDAKLEIIRNATEEQQKLEDDVANIRVQTQRNVINALRSLNQGLLGDSKALAIGILAVEKGLAISEVIVQGTQKAFEATSQALSLLSNPFTAALAPQAFAMAAKIKTLTALNVAAIAAQGLGEAGQIITGGGSASTTGGSTGSQRQMGFFESEPQRAMGAQPINITLEGEFDDEVLSIKAERGSNKRRRGTQFSV